MNTRHTYLLAKGTVFGESNLVIARDKVRAEVHNATRESLWTIDLKEDESDSSLPKELASRLGRRLSGLHAVIYISGEGTSEPLYFGRPAGLYYEYANGTTVYTYTEGPPQWMLECMSDLHVSGVPTSIAVSRDGSSGVQFGVVLGGQSVRQEFGRQSEEIGVFAANNRESGELGLRGALARVGDSKIDAADFSFAHRHRIAGRGLTAEITGTGMHPVIRLSGFSESDRKKSCPLYAYFGLDQALFADPYQLENMAQFGADGIRRVVSYTGRVDLESPEWQAPGTGNMLLLEIGEEGNVEVPLHLRYADPQDSGKKAVAVAAPVVFHACSDEALEPLRHSPFDRRAGYEDHFKENTVFQHILTDGARLRMEMPVAERALAWRVQMLTMGAIIFGFLYVVSRIGRRA